MLTKYKSAGSLIVFGIALIWIAMLLQLFKEGGDQNRAHADSSYGTEVISPDLSIPSSGAELFARVRETMNFNYRIESNLRLNIDLFGEKFSGAGKYSEYCEVSNINGREYIDRNNTMYRFEVNKFQPTSSVTKGAEPSFLVIVCDRQNSKSIWKSQSIEGKRSLKRIMLDEFMETLNEFEHNFKNYDMSAYPNLGGLGGILWQINEFYEFEEGVADVKIDLDGHNISVWKIKGKIRPEKKEELMNKLGGNPKNKKNDLEETPHIPEELEISIGQHNLFPYAFEYYVTKGSKKQMLLELVFTDVLLNNLMNSQLSPSFFEYIPGEKIFVEDATEAYINSLNLKKRKFDVFFPDLY